MSGYQTLTGLGLQVVPLERWPGPRTPDDQREWSPFSANLSATVELLARELSALSAERVTLGLGLTRGQIRNDGLPRSDARCDDPGAMLAFDSSKGPLRFACDRYITRGYYSRGSGASWQDNLRAIALGLEALRKVDRYGITSDGQQYRGFAELGTGMAMPATHMTSGEAYRIITGMDPPPGPVNVRKDLVQEAYRRRAKKAHPDGGGSTEEFLRLTQARDLLLRDAS